MGIFTPSRLAVLSLAALAGQACGQSFNIEVGTSAAVPSSSFGGAAGSAGTWNAVTSSTAASITLKNLDGSNSSVTMTHSTAGSFFNNSNPNISGDFQSLMGDVQADSTITYSFTNLTPGQYIIYTYAADVHSSMNVCNVTINNSLGVVTQDSGYNTPDANYFRVADTHTIHSRIVNIGDTVTITITPKFGGIAELAGIQIVRMGNNGVLPRFYVNDTAAGTGGGRSWTNAMTDLQEALESSRRIGSGNEIWVASGFYYPTSGTDQTISFEIPSGVKLYGGFTGTETSLTQRTNPWFNITALSGSIGSSSLSDNTQCVVDASNTGGSTVIDGFSVTRGYNDSAAARGGGMLLNGSFATVRNVKFLSNWAGAGGGGVSCDAGNPKLINCYFFQNDTESTGGGLLFRNNSTALQLVNCQFIGNTASMGGGGLATSAATVNVTNSLFTGNQTFSLGYGGGAYLLGNSSFATSSTFTNCTFSRNQGVSGGGAIYLTGKMQCSISSSILWNNTAPNGSAGTEETAVSFNNSFLPSFNQSTVKGKAGFDGLDPLFVDADGGNNVVGDTDDNLRLKPGSPCIDSGWASLLPSDFLDVDEDGNTAEQIPEDLDFKPRRSDVLGVADGPSAGAPALDRGCYELQMPVCPADMNKDSVVDLADFFEFFNAWDVSGAAADVDLSGDVDLGDFFTFFSFFDSSCL
jgi:predicted outer membrane repeat protein